MGMGSVSQMVCLFTSRLSTVGQRNNSALREIHFLLPSRPADLIFSKFVADRKDPEFVFGESVCSVNDTFGG